jgi:acyl-coenzyme A synthetase/AMP-(fatty) acid ligase
MYTSGSTGKPKAVKQRLTEFENDNRFVLSKWGEEFLQRTLCSTVSPHHIYGLLFSILLPFTAGVPFRRNRIEFPEELEKLSDTQYMIITVPAFLKRAVEIEQLSGLPLKSPWIFTSGGVLDPETARKTRDVFGFWPVEVYGSTETSGIAWRQSVNGLEWTPFDNAQLSKNEDGCLVIRSPYIKDPSGFETADMVEMREDGRFLLKGRFDSVVKIEEKRISLPEVESRILQSGLAADVCVIFLEDKRQYLAAAIVLNDKGKAQFAGLAKHEINTFWKEYLLRYFENIVIPKKWRYLEALPVNTQGKKQKDDIKLLFSGEQGGGGGSAGFESLDKITVIEKNENSVSLEFSIPDTSPYFDGHFPGFTILPAVAQMEVITRFASRYLGTSVGLSEIRRVKFTSLVRPCVPLLLKLVKKENAISFYLSSPKGEKAYSSGTVVPGNE